MGSFHKQGGFNNRGDRGGFGRGGGGRSGGFRDRGERAEMFTATCDECHKQCEVPFRPSGDKPVYCNDCFRNRREESSGDFGRREKPSYPRKDSSSNSTGHDDKKLEELKKQVDSLSGKIDKILNILSNTNQTPVQKTKSEELTFLDEPVTEKVKVAPKKTEKKPAPKKATVSKKKTK